MKLYGGRPFTEGQKRRVAVKIIEGGILAIITIVTIAGVNTVTEAFAEGMDKVFAFIAGVM